MESSVVSRVFLTGFMGAGKTTVGSMLAARLNWRFFDVDTLIEDGHSSTVAALFALHGEAAFRAMELEATRGVHREKQAVISLGGGALESADVRALLSTEPDSKIIFLEAPLPLLVDRCLAQDTGASRPVLRDRVLLESRYNVRLPFYRNAHLTVTTEFVTPEEVAATIHRYLAALHHGNNRDPIDS